MKYNPIMEKLDLPAKEELLHWDPKALILSEEKAFRQRVIEVFWRAEAEESQVILLSGPTSSGKTTASRILAEGLTRGGNRAVRISLDDFYKDRSQAPLWEDGQKNFETIVHGGPAGHRPHQGAYLRLRQRHPLPPQPGPDL